MIIEVIGYDPSLRNWGCVTALLNIEDMTLRVTSLRIIETSETKVSKKLVRQNAQDVNASRLLVEGVRETVADAVIAFAEVPVGSQSSRAQTSYGVCCGVLGSIDIPLISVTPTEVKKAATGHGAATKEEMIEWAVSKHPEAPWFTINRKTGVELLNKNEHVADALAAIYAGMQTAEFREAVKILKSMV